MSRGRVWGARKAFRFGRGVIAQSPRPPSRRRNSGFPTRSTSHGPLGHAPSRCERNSSCTSWTAAAPSRSRAPTSCLNESLVATDRQPRDAPGRQCVHAVREQQAPERSAHRSSSSVRRLIAMRSRSPATLARYSALSLGTSGGQGLMPSRDATAAATASPSGRSCWLATSSA